MKKLFALLGIIVTLPVYSQQMEGFPYHKTIAYFNSFDQPLNETMHSYSGEIFEFDSTNINMSYDGTPVFSTSSGVSMIHIVLSNPMNNLSELDSITISMRVKEISNCESSHFVLAYTTNNKNFAFVDLYEGNPTNYYHNITSTIPTDGASWLRFKFYPVQVEGCGNYYIDDIIIQGDTPQMEPPVFTDSCVFDSNGDNEVNHVDLLNFLAVYGSICE
jgi:hypothetical protein